jgi:hypothetical protein
MSTQQEESTTDPTTDEISKKEDDEPPSKRFKLERVPLAIASLAQGCWRFLNAMTRDELEPLPGNDEATPTPLEAYLLIAYATSQAALIRSSNFPVADAGVHHLFPGATTLRTHTVSATEWDAFQGRAREAMRELTRLNAE